jgi:hypothetical protein
MISIGLGLWNREKTKISRKNTRSRFTTNLNGAKGDSLPFILILPSRLYRSLTITGYTMRTIGLFVSNKIIDAINKRAA